MIALDTEKYYPAFGKSVWAMNAYIVLLAVLLYTGSSNRVIQFGLICGLVLAFVQFMHVDTMYGREVERLKNRVENLEKSGEGQ